jgi:hypothetical protein
MTRPTQIWKQVLRPGSFVCDAGNGRTQVFDVDAKLIDHFHRTGKAMLAANLSIPCPMEHSQGLKPMTDAEKDADRLRNNAGFIGDWAIRSGTLWGRVDVGDPELAKRLPTTVRYVSPEVLPSMVDGAGRSWSRFISHVCLTTRPVDADQERFADNIALSLGSVPWWQNPVPVSLSLANRLPSPPRQSTVIHEMDRQLAYYLRLDQNKLTRAEVQAIVKAQHANRKV